MVTSVQAAAEPDLLSILHRHWGYDSFRPLQERVIRSTVGGHDVALVMPTGGGKSLCYQLPAVVLGGTCIVVSPLIALMKDQAAHLASAGIPAAALNSTMPYDEQRQVMRDAARGAYRLLYLSPERLARADTIAWLQRVPVAFFAIDEAHCISEWGHEFRPEYRELWRLREAFPDRPISAFTASATQRVRHDILRQLRLRDPHCYITSFRRPNLSYIVRECIDPLEQERMLLGVLRAHAGKNVIVYCPTIRSVESTTSNLNRRGIRAVSYHGQMEASERTRNQETWMRDDKPVLVGTIAFGLGINKPSVRAVIHLSLPKSLEQYYQEAGRAGRDGQPADCLLLWQRSDIGLLAHFASQIEDEEERKRAWWRLKVMRGFAETRTCRQRQICMHFGERPKWGQCEVCDVCGYAPAWLTEDAPHPVGLGRRSKKKKRPAAAAAPPAPEELPDAEPALVERVRAWRLEKARVNGVAPFVVLHDRTMLEICRRRPADFDELLQIIGMGPGKVQRYGSELLQLIAEPG
jgi:ATP-dependent DNA helicase RecQ